LKELLVKKQGGKFFILIKNEWMPMDSVLALEMFMKLDIVRIEYLPSSS
jgi:hypothetical protein